MLSWFFSLYSSKLVEPDPSEAGWCTAVVVPEMAEQHSSSDFTLAIYL